MELQDFAEWLEDNGYLTNYGSTASLVWEFEMQAQQNEAEAEQCVKDMVSALTPQESDTL